MSRQARNLPVGKLPSNLLAKLLSGLDLPDSQVKVGPGVGLDCAVVQLGDRLLVFKSDPITFVAEDIGFYLVQVNANDLATTGAQPRWLLLTMLLPEGGTRVETVERILKQVDAACRELGVRIIGGHTEITHGLSRPILVGTLIGQVDTRLLVTPRGARPGDHILLTKGVPIEATAILAREVPHLLARGLNQAELRQACGFLYRPGISVVADARIALRAGQVSAMHDPTEGGLIMGLWELAQASGRRLCFEPSAVPIPPLSARVCQILRIDPLRAIASGALLLTAPPTAASRICYALESNGILCVKIGAIEPGAAGLWQISKDQHLQLSAPPRDEIAKFFEENRAGAWRHGEQRQRVRHVI